VWDQLKKGPEPGQAVIIPRVLMMPRMNLMLNATASTSPASSDTPEGARHDDDDGDGDYLVNNGNTRRLEERREAERERRERRRLRASADAALASSQERVSGVDSGFLASSTSTSPTASETAAESFAHFSRALMREDGAMDEDEMEDDGAEGRRAKKRSRRDETEREVELEGDEDELEYGEGVGEAPKLASMQGKASNLACSMFQCRSQAAC
jgi:hypothetical protein